MKIKKASLFNLGRDLNGVLYYFEGCSVWVMHTKTTVLFSKTSNDPVWLWNICLVSLTHSTVVFQHIMQTAICLQGHFYTSQQCESSSLWSFVALSSYKSVFSQCYLLTRLLGIWVACFVLVDLGTKGVKNLKYIVCLISKHLFFALNSLCAYWVARVDF